MENQKMQTEINCGIIRKFYLPGMILGTVSVLLSFFCLPVMGILTGVVGLAINIKKRKEYRAKIGIVLSIIGLIGALGYMGMLFFHG